VRGYDERSFGIKEGSVALGTVHGFAGMTEGLAQRRARHAQSLEQALDEIVDQLGHMPAVRKVVLFGSFAGGHRDLCTDLDIIVVMESDLDFVARNAEVAGRIHCGVALDLLVYTPAEIERMRERPFMRHALATGKVMYENDGA
jgi:predicted nucleotidyltransferase